jgi:hypothetical protein
VLVVMTVFVMIVSVIMVMMMVMMNMLHGIETVLACITIHLYFTLECFFCTLD